MADHRKFLRALERNADTPTLFEPFAPRRLISQILWRAGDSLWDTDKHMADTLISFFRYIKADTAVIPSNGETGLINECAAICNDLKLTVLSDNIDVLEYADTLDAVCALASNTYQRAARFSNPLIHISSGDEADIQTAIKNGAAAVYVPCGIESLLERYACKITLIGGISDSIQSSAPAKIHRRIRELFASEFANAYILGSGALNCDIDYLGFISMLHMYNTLT